MSIFDKIFNPDTFKDFQDIRGIQNIYTPVDKIVEATGFDFVSVISPETKEIGVLFNFEFVEYILKNINKDYINNIKLSFFYDSLFDFEQSKFIAYKYNFNNIEFISIEKFSESKNINDLENKMANKKFDIVFSNPPYDRSLHLKIINGCTDISEKIVWISPIRWIESLANFHFQKYKLYEKNILKHIEQIYPIALNKAEEMFKAAFNFDLGICIFNSKTSNIKINPLKLQGYTCPDLCLNIFNKVIKNTPNVWKNVIKNSSLENISVITSLICGGNNGRTKFLSKYFWTPFNKVCFINNKRLDNNLSFFENRKLTCWGNVKPKEIQWHIEFNSLDEAKNFYNSCQTEFWRFMHMLTVVDVNVHPELLIFMNDYSKEWTNEDFYQFFGITKEEQEYIEETMKQFQ